MGGQRNAAGGGTGGTSQILTTGGTVLTTGGRGGASSATAISCGLPANPVNGSVSVPAQTYGSTATYSCTPGFALSGAATRTCQDDGTWSGDVPTCVAVDVVCESPSGIANGVVSAPITKYGATASYYCSSAYSLQGSATRTCQADGTWDGTAPTCVCDMTCNGVCTDIKMDTNNCGGCGTICPAVPSPSTTQCMLGRCLVTLATGQSIRHIAVDTSSVYWNTNDAIVGNDSVNKVPLGGGPPTTLVSNDTIDGNIAVDASSVYWVRLTFSVTNSAWYIMAVPLDGGSPTTLAEGSGLVGDAGNVYWITGSGLMKASLGGGTPTTVASIPSSFFSMAVDATHTYWTTLGTLDDSYQHSTDGTVMKAPFGGGTPTTIASAQDTPHNLVVDATSAYWIAGGSVTKASLDGGSPITLTSGMVSHSYAASIAVDTSYVYWTNGAFLYSGGAVMKVPIGGGTATTLAIAQDTPWGIAVDDSSVYWAANTTVVRLSPK